MEDGTSWKETQDHAKWAVGDEKSSTACVGDINRQYSQSKRGGGTLCHKSKDVWTAFDAIVSEVTDPCD